MQIRVRVDVDGMYWRGGSEVVVPELLRECFSPVDVCSDVFMAGITGGETTASMKAVLRVRADAAKILSDELVELILREMGRGDTEDGYEKG